MPSGSLPTEGVVREDSAVPAVRSGSVRLSALDAWRGLTILLMLLVNNIALGPLTPIQLQHAPWGGGITLTDLVFPWFLFCAGAALPFSLAAAQKAGYRGWKLAGKLITRSALLYLVGCLVTSVAEHRLTLGLGVLQLIALASLFGGLVTLGSAVTLGSSVIVSSVSLLGTRWRLSIWRLGVAAALLIGYDLFLNVYPLGGVQGVFTEDLNPVKAINDVLLSPLGLRGLISVIPTTALVLLGSVVAQVIKDQVIKDQVIKDRKANTPWLLLASGVVMTLLGWLWARHLEFNKSVWTPSYVVYTSGLATLGMLAFYLLADSGRRWSSLGGRLLAPLTIPGRNALLAYVAPILLKVWILMDWNVDWAGKSMPIQAALLSLARTHVGAWYGGWLYTLGYILAVWLGLAYLARRGWTWKL